MATKKKVTKKTTKPSGTKPGLPATPATPPDPAQPISPPDPGLDPVVPDPDRPGTVEVTADGFDPSTIYPELGSPPEGFESAFPEFEREDYAGEIKGLREGAAEMIAQAEAMEADYRIRYPAHRQLKPQHQNVINAAHAKLRRKERRAALTAEMGDVKKAGALLRRATEFIGGSRLDRVLRQRGKDPSMRRKHPLALKTPPKD